MVGLLMNTAQYEFVLKSKLRSLLDMQIARWDECKKDAADRLSELSEYFSGAASLTRVKKNENLQAWFKQLSEEITLLDYNNSIVAGRKIAQLMTALEDVQEFHQVCDMYDYNVDLKKSYLLHACI
jgi:WASH complex subunit strumpellin